MATKRNRPALTIRSGNGGLTVRVNLWSMKKYLPYFDSHSASLAIAGEVTREGQKGVKFHGPGELLSVLAKWNSEKFRDLKREEERKKQSGLKPDLKRNP